MDRTRAYKKVRICSGCGKTYEDVTGTYEGKITRLKDEPVSCMTILDFQFCKKCSKQVAELKFIEVVGILEFNEEIDG